MDFAFINPSHKDYSLKIFLLWTKLNIFKVNSINFHVHTSQLHNILSCFIYTFSSILCLPVNVQFCIVLFLRWCLHKLKCTNLNCSIFNKWIHLCNPHLSQNKEHFCDPLGIVLIISVFFRLILITRWHNLGLLWTRKAKQCKKSPCAMFFLLMCATWKLPFKIKLAGLLPVNWNSNLTDETLSSMLILFS